MKFEQFEQRDLKPEYQGPLNLLILEHKGYTSPLVTLRTCKETINDLESTEFNVLRAYTGLSPTFGAVFIGLKELVDKPEEFISLLEKEILNQ